VIAQSYRRHRHNEFLRFLKPIDGAEPKDLDLHLADNYATHKTPNTPKWLLRHRRFPRTSLPQPVVVEPRRVLVRGTHHPQASLVIPVEYLADAVFN
jgi:hypothetical protein